VIDEITAIGTPRKSIKKKGTEIYERSVWKFGRKRERERERERERNATVFNIERGIVTS